MTHTIIIKVVGVLFILGGIIHWLIIFGVLKEIAPFFITIYFHSLAVFSPLAGIGLVLIKKWGRKTGLLIALTQIPAHLYMLYLDNFANWESGLTVLERGIDIVFAIFFLSYFNSCIVKERFRDNLG